MGATRLWKNIDVAEMIRLVNALHQSKGGMEARKQTLLQGLCNLVAASSALLLMDGAHDGDGGGDAHWSSNGEAHGSIVRRALMKDGKEGDPAFRKVRQRVKRRRNGSVATFTRRDLLDDGAWYGSMHVRDIRRRVGLDDSIYSALVVASDKVACLCLLRPWGTSSTFGQREKGILDLMHPACAWVYLGKSLSTDVDSLALSPREKQTLWNLLAGRGEKEIAAEMRLSVNTVHHYVKALYKHFGVSSRAELLSRWLGRQG